MALAHYLIWFGQAVLDRCHRVVDLSSFRVDCVRKLLPKRQAIRFLDTSFRVSYRPGPQLGLEWTGQWLGHDVGHGALHIFRAFEVSNEAPQ